MPNFFIIYLYQLRRTSLCISTVHLYELQLTSPYKPPDIIMQVTSSRGHQHVQTMDSSEHLTTVPVQWGAADAEIKVPSDENTELKGSPFKAWSRSVYCHACYAYCQEFLPYEFIPFRSIHLHFFQNLSQVVPVLAAANTGSCAGPQNKIGHLARCWFPC